MIVIFIISWLVSGILGSILISKDFARYDDVSLSIILLNVFLFGFFGYISLLIGLILLLVFGRLNNPVIFPKRT